VPAAKPAPVQKSAVVPQKPAPAAETPAPAPKKQVVARVDKKPEKAAASGTPGKLELVVTPWGEVLIDGKNRGVSPPLRVVELTPGTHTIEIRNSTFPAHVQKVQVKPGEAVRIRHRFK
jgi:hypothetical protein